MAYRKVRRQYRLTFEDHPGLTVVMGPLSVREFLAISRLADKTEGPEAAAAAAELFGYVGKALVSWDLQEEDGTPVPASADGVLDQDLDLILAIVQGWTSAVGDVAPPLPQGSRTGPHPAELELAASSRSLSS